jgi:xanthine dehydrogenase accessory factor
MNWLDALSQCASQNSSCVLITVIESAGSAPRVLGTRMVVTEKYCADTLGGGALEHEAIEYARDILKSAARGPVITHREFVLGSDLAQCCGGRVKLQFDCHWVNDFILNVFGAGHVAQEVARVVQRLSCRATFHDSRKEWLEKLNACVDTGAISSSVTTSVLSENVYASVDACQSGSYFLVMTHSHELDMELIEAILARGDARYCGLIASKSKAISFRGRLKRKGFTEDELASLTAPLGQHFQTGNTPMEVAVAAIGDILHLRNVVAGGRCVDEIPV